MGYVYYNLSVCQGQIVCYDLANEGISTWVLLRMGGNFGLPQKERLDASKS